MSSLMPLLNAVVTSVLTIHAGAAHSPDHVACRCDRTWRTTAEHAAHQADEVTAALSSKFGLTEEYGVYEIDGSSMTREKRHLAHVPEDRRYNLHIVMDRKPGERHLESRLITNWHDIDQPIQETR